MSCENGCLELQTPACESPVLGIGLAVGTELFSIVSRPGSSKVYKKQVVVDVFGNIVLQKADYPAGYFCKGFRKVSFTTSPGGTELQPVTISGSQYDCVMLKLVDIVS